jgi:hypothetical protein
MFAKPFKHLSAALVTTLALAAAAPQAAHADENADRTADLSKRFTYNNVTSTEAGRIFSSLGIQSTYNPKKMKNPDPLWIPGWDALSLTDETQTAVLQAAINRTWMAQVHKDYKRYRAAWAAIEQKFRPELERAKTGTYYQRADALSALYDAVRKQADADKVLYDGWAIANLGFLNEVVLAMVEMHRETKHEFLLSSYMSNRNIAIAKFAATARPFAPDDVERELFTAVSQDNGNLDSPQLPKMMEYGKAFAAVKWPTVNKAAEAKKIAAKLVETNAAALTFKVILAQDLLNGGTPPAEEPKLVHVDSPTKISNEYTPLVVKKLGKTLTLETDRSKSDPYGCKVNPYNRMETYDCKYKTTKIKHTLEVTPSELPDGVQLQKGDEITFYADLEAKKDTKTTRSFKLTMRTLASVTRGGKVVWSLK